MIDLKNFYGESSLKLVAQCLNSHPELAAMAPVATLIYGSKVQSFITRSASGELLIIEDVNQSSLYQGETLAAALSTAVSKEIVGLAMEELSPEERRQIIIKAIIDDITAYATYQIMVKFFRSFCKHLLELRAGSINLGKTCILPPSYPEMAPPIAVFEELANEMSDILDPQREMEQKDRIQVKKEGSVTLGIPQGSEKFKCDTLSAEAREMGRIMARLKQVNNPQIEYHMIRWCLAGTSMGFMRNMAPSLTVPLLLKANEFEIEEWLKENVSETKAMVHRIQELPEAAKLIAGINCGYGGLGLPASHSQIAPHAFLCSTLMACNTLIKVYGGVQNGPNDLIMKLVQELIKMPETLQDREIKRSCRFKWDLLDSLEVYKELMGSPRDVRLIDIMKGAKKIQSVATNTRSKMVAAQILGMLPSDHQKAGWVSQTAPGAACVFNAPPTDREFEIPTEEWNLLMRMRLHVFLDPLFLPKPSMFQSIELGEGQLDEFECRLCNHRGAGANYVHLLTCPGGGGTIRRHDDVANTWAALLTTSGIIYNYQEPRPVPGTTHRTDHEFHFDNQDKAYDLAVTTAQAKSNLPNSAS